MNIKVYEYGESRHPKPIATATHHVTKFTRALHAYGGRWWLEPMRCAAHCNNHAGRGQEDNGTEKAHLHGVVQSDSSSVAGAALGSAGQHLSRSSGKQATTNSRAVCDVPGWIETSRSPRSG
jgi:hypothetical protein